MPRRRRANPPSVLKVSFLVEREECPELYRWLTKLRSGHASRLIRERLERSLEVPRSDLAQGSFARFTPPGDLRGDPGDSAPASRMCPAPRPGAGLAKELSPPDEVVRDPAQILLEMAQNF